jgi:transcriptional regulator with XRE-family HTH domain
VHHSRATTELRSRLRGAREQAGLSQSEAAQLASVRPNDISRAENGLPASPALVAKIAAAVATYSTVMNGHSEQDPVAVWVELDDRVKALERRLDVLEEGVARAASELRLF